MGSLRNLVVTNRNTNLLNKNNHILAHFVQISMQQGSYIHKMVYFCIYNNFYIALAQNIGLKAANKTK